MIQGHHVYKDIVMPTIGKILQNGREPDNSYDSFAVAIIKNYIIILVLRCQAMRDYNYTIVGHVPRYTSSSNSIPTTC